MLGFQGGVSIPLVKGGVKAPPAKRQCRAGPKAGARRGFTIIALISYAARIKNSVVSLDSVYEYERAISENAPGTLLRHNTQSASGARDGVPHPLLSPPCTH